jgi:hypothetical protein
VRLFVVVSSTGDNEGVIANRQDDLQYPMRMLAIQQKNALRWHIEPLNREIK